jgi:hypothetical protein
LTAGFILFGVLALFLIAVVPAVLDWLALPISVRRGIVDPVVDPRQLRSRWAKHHLPFSALDRRL